MADIKSLLKEARKLIDNKDYKGAQEFCKNILRKDKQNYLGLVLLGKSLQDSDQAALAFQKAIASKPEHPLAWQGLAYHLEHREDAKVKLITVYDEILKLEIDEEKALEIITKLGQLGCSLKDNQAVSIILNYMDIKLSDNLFSAAEKQLIDLLKADLRCKEDEIVKVVHYLSKAIEKEPNNVLYILLGKVTLQKINLADAMSEVMDLSFFTLSVTFREWLCKFLCNYYVQHSFFSGFDIEQYIDKITVGIENSKYPGLLRSMILYEKGLYIEAYKQCVPLVNYQEADITEATLILKCTFMLKKFSIAQKLATNFLLKVKEKHFAVILTKYLFLSLAEQQKWKQALLIAAEIPMHYLDIDEQALLAKCYIENNEQADVAIKNLKETEHYIQLEALTLIKQEKYADVIKLLEKSPDKPLNLFYIGQAYWKLEQFDKSLIYLLKAAKINADHADTFLYLGMIYQHYKQDLEKTKKCYEKAFSLNSIDVNIIKNLSDTYSKLGLHDADFDLLCKASLSVQNEPKVRFRLGLHYVNRRDWENAILQFRNVIKADHTDIIAFECLADAYFSRGSFTSALKAYNKVISMKPSKILHCLTRIGYINSLLTQYDEAIATFEKVFEIEPESLLALKGIAVTWMRIARKKYNAKLFGSARDTVQYAINYLIKALSKEKKFLCFWNLLAEALIFITKLPDEYCYVHMKSSLTDVSDIVRKEKNDIFLQALSCYSRILKQKLQFTSFDLASTYVGYYHATKEMVNCQIAFKLTIANIKLKPTSWRNWNLLGKICVFMKKYALAQHCFIKALLVTRKWSVAKIWCNLGTLYVKLGHYKLANYCFWRGQSTLPSHPQSWIGQALIAEVIQEEEAMDLFRHACRLCYHPESAMGYADWVCQTLKNNYYKISFELKYVIDGLHAISYAMDLVLWFIRYEPNNAFANNVLGILQERSKLLDSALVSYQKAFQYADEDKKNMILLNIARALLRLGRYDEAIKTYKDITEASLNSACGLALALFKKELYEESYSTYDTALHWLCNNDDEKADLLVAMSGIVYMFKGIDDAKTLLFHSIQVSQKNPTPYSLFAICSLGIIHSDQGLSKLALSELEKYQKDSKFGYDIGFLKSYLALNDVNTAIKLLSDSLHDHPSSTELWSCMAQYCLQASNSKEKIASSCAQRALCSANQDKHDNSAKMLATASIAEHIAGNNLKSLILAKAGLHMYPCQSEIWAVLLFSIITDKNWFEKPKWTLRVTGHMRKNLNTTRSLNRWINLLEKKLSRYLNK